MLNVDLKFLIDFDRLIGTFFFTSWFQIPWYLHSHKTMWLWYLIDLHPNVVVWIFGIHKCSLYELLVWYLCKFLFIVNRVCISEGKRFFLNSKINFSCCVEIISLTFNNLRSMKSLFVWQQKSEKVIILRHFFWRLYLDHAKLTDNAHTMHHNTIWIFSR